MPGARPAWSVPGTGEPAAEQDRPARWRGSPLAGACGLLALLPLLVLGPPPPVRVPPGAVVDRLERVLGTGEHAGPLGAVEAVTWLRFHSSYAQGRTIVYRCESPGEVRAVAVTDAAGDSVYRPMPIDEHRTSRDGGAPVLVCDGTRRALLALLVQTAGEESAPAPGPLPMLLVTRTAPADRPTAYGPRTPIG